MGKQEQDGTIAPETGHSFKIEIDAAPEYADRADFSAAQWGDHHKKLRYKKANAWYLHTFKWDRTHRNQRITRATLVVDLTALSTGGDRRSDKIMITRPGGEPLGLYSEPCYINSTHHPIQGCSSVLSANGKEVRKIWIIDGLPLQKLNDSGTLSIAIGDDSYVRAATLTIEGE
jgi:hypothetical protein